MTSITSPRGTMIPLTAGATGKIFLAYLDEKSTLRYLADKGLTRYTENSITDVDAYMREIREVRNRGFATDHNEYLQGVNAVATLIKTEGPYLAAIWVVGFSSSLRGDKMEDTIEKALHAADAISQDMRQRGWR